MRRSLLGLLACLLPAVASAANPAVTPLSRMNIPWWAQKFQESLAQVKADPEAQVIWLGDSITMNWMRTGGHGYDDYLPVWQRDYGAPYHALALGLKGDTTASLIWRLEHGQVAGLHPKLVVMLIGANNVGRVHWGAQLTIPGIEACVAKTQALLPGTHILLLGILPSIRNAWVDAQVPVINAALKQRYAGDPGVTYLDVGGVLLTDGKPDRAKYLDPHLVPPDPPLHPDAQAMAAIAQAIAPEVRRYAG